MIEDVVRLKLRSQIGLVVFQLALLNSIDTVVGKEFFNNNRSLGIFFGKVIKRFDDTNIYRVDYNDGDREDYNIDELLPILQIDDDRIDRIRIAHVNLVNVLLKVKISKEDDKYFFVINF